MNLQMQLMQVKARGSNLETDDATKTSHLTLGNVMLGMTWQAWIINSDYLEKKIVD